MTPNFKSWVTSRILEASHGVPPSCSLPFGDRVGTLLACLLQSSHAMKLTSLKRRPMCLAVGEEVVMQIPKDSEISWKLMKVMESGIDSREKSTGNLLFRGQDHTCPDKSFCWHKQTESKSNTRWALPQLPGRIWQCRCACWPPTSWVTGSSALWCLSRVKHGTLVHHQCQGAEV